MRNTRIWRLGLTGGIGSGKSTVASLLAELGAVVVDADAISRSLTAVGGRALPAIRAQFGAAMIAADGAMDRQAMRARAFADPQARQALEAIIHPLVAQITQEQSQAALQAGARCLVHDVPLLVESGTRWRARMDRVLVVDCEANTQRERVARRSGLAFEEIDRIIAQQASRAQRLACADLVLYNQDLTLPQLREQVRQIGAGFGL